MMLFLFLTKKEFCGVVSPYYLFRDRSLTTKSKLKSAAMMPPKLGLHTSLSDAAQAMLESKIHYLPVFNEDNQFTGIVTIGRLFRYVMNKHLLNHKGRNYLYK
jgi:CBS-domain-containing membrane protein